MEDFQERQEETILKQTNLLRQQKTVLDALQSELLECQSKSSVLQRQNQTKIETILNQFKDSSDAEYLEEIKLLRRQIEDALKEKELLASENSKLLLELQQTRNGQISKTEDERTPRNHINSQYVEVIQILEDESDRLRKELINCEDEKLQILKKDHMDLNKISALEEVISEYKEQIEALRSALEESQQQISNLQRRVVPQHEEICRLQERTDILQKEKDNFHKILSTVKDKLVEGEKKVAQTLRVAEDAILEKDAALLREKHALDEINRLEINNQELMKESGMKTKKEVCKVKDNFNNKVKEMSEEVVHLEMKLKEKQMDEERCLIEKKKMEKELDNLAKEIEKMKQAKKEESERMAQRITELERKNIRMSIDKENATLKLNKLSNDHKIYTEESSKRIFDLEAKLKSTGREIVKYKDAIEELNQEKIILNEKMFSEREAFSKRERFILNQLKKTCQELENSKSSFEKRLETSQKPQASLITQLFSNLEALQKQVERLQSLHKSQVREFELKLYDSRAKCDDLASKNENLLESLQESESKLLIHVASNKEYKERLETIEKELEEMKVRYSSLVRSARKLS